MTTTTKSTKISIVALPNLRDPVIRRREQCIERLEDQKKLLLDSAYVRVTIRRKKGAEPTEHRQKVTQWWSGVRSGVALRLRFVQGSNGVVVGSIKELAPAIDDIISQIRAGELDAMITPAPKEKKTAAQKAEALAARVKAAQAKLAQADKKKAPALSVVGRRIGSRPK